MSDEEVLRKVEYSRETEMIMSSINLSRSNVEEIQTICERFTLKNYKRHAAITLSWPPALLNKLKSISGDNFSEYCRQALIELADTDIEMSDFFNRRSDLIRTAALLKMIRDEESKKQERSCWNGMNLNKIQTVRLE